MARTYEISFKLGAQMAGNFAKTMTSASGALGQLNERIGSLNKQQSSIQTLVRLRQQVGESAREYNNARQRVAELGRQISKTKNPSREMTREFEKAQRQASQTKQRLTEKRRELRQLDTTMGTTGQSTKDLVRRQQELAKSAEKARGAQSSLQKTMSDIDANQQKRGKLRGQLFDAVAMGAALATPIKIAMDFESQMAKVGAVSQASDKDLARLTQTARELGATTNWSASQAASGMQFLSQAGFSVDQSIGAMPGMLDLASAGAIDLGNAADIASNVLSGFNMEAEQMGRLGDVLTNTFTSSNTDLNMLGQTMAYVAPVADSTGQSLEVTAAMAGKLGDAGIQGSKAGTALRSMMNRLAAPTGKAADMINDLGIQTQDASGNMRSLPDIMADMDQSMKGMGNAARQEVMSTVFGLEAASAASVLLGQSGSGELQKYAESLKETGSASRVAEKQNDNAQGAMKRLASAAESIAITFGNILLPALASGAEIMAKVVGVADSLAQQFPLVTSVVVGGVAALIALKVAAIAGGYAFTFLRGAWLKGLAVIKTLRVAYLLHTGALVAGTKASKAAVIVSKAMTAAQWLFNAALSANPIGLVIAAIAGLIAAGVALYKNWDSVTKFFSKSWEGMKNLLSGFAPLSWMMSGFKSLTSWLSGFSLKNLFSRGFNATKNLFMNFTPLGWMLKGIKALAGWADGFSLKDLFAAGFNAAKNLFSSFNPFSWMLSGINALVQWSTGFSVKELLVAGYNAAKNMLSNFNPLSWMMSGFKSLTSWLSNFSLFSSGKKMLDTLASGIKSAVSGPVNAVKNGLAKVRQYLPFSDAKVGPLSQLTASGSAIMDTLSKGMGMVSPQSMMKPFANTAKSMVQGFQDGGIGGAINRLSGSGASQPAGGGSAGGMTVQITQQITIDGTAGGDVESQARSGAREGADEMIDKLKSAMARERRLSYA